MSDGDALKFHQDLAEQMIIEVQSWNESSGADLEALRRLARKAVLPEMLASFLGLPQRTAGRELMSSCSLYDTPGTVVRPLT